MKNSGDHLINFYELSMFSKTLINIISIALFTALMLSAGNASGVAKKEIGNVKNKKGSANILRETQKIKIYKNESVFKEDTVKTLDKSRVKILFVDDSLLMIGENSVILVSEYFKGTDKKAGKSVFNLVDGVINVIVGKKGFEIHTPTAISAARGTSYLLWVEKGKTGMAVTEGTVKFKNSEETVGGELIITAGKMSYVAKGKPPTSPVITPPEIIKVFYKQTLEEKERWGPVILSAKGSGIPPPSAVNPAQARLLALRAAKVEALRNLLEQAYSVSIISDSTIQDFTLKSDVIKSRVESFIKGAWVAEERQMTDGSYEVLMEIGLGIGFRRMFLEIKDKN
jgi:hypothetical protein